MVRMMLSQSRHVFKAVISSMVDSTTPPSFTFGARARSILNFGSGDIFRAFPFFSTNCREVVSQLDGEVLLLRFLERLKNYEKEGVPTGAGTNSVAGFDLQRMERLLVRLGNPLSSYPVVHVAGTKGKGSTVNFISSILRAAGLSVGTYTSPHVTSIRERITAGRSGSPISSNALSKLVTDLQATVDEAVAEESGLLTHFEVSPRC